jgi:hypothetical protein
MSLARATDDPSLKRRYESLALNFLERGDERHDAGSRSESRMTARITALGRSGTSSGDRS